MKVKTYSKLVKIQLINNGKTPVYSHYHDAGADAFSNIDCVIAPNTLEKIPLGFKVEIPVGYELQVRPKSGLVLNHGLTILNSPGTIDCNYRGEVMALVYNAGEKSYVIDKHTKICQLVLNQVPKANFMLTDSLSKTTRGDGGFGSTGLN